MEVSEVIKTRRSIGKVKDDMLPKEIIEKIIDSATWAPNRYHTNPWRFYVISGEGRNRLSKVMEEIVLQSGIDVSSEEGAKKLEKERNKPFRAPVIIAVAAKVTVNEKVIPLEELGATYAAIQNMLLTAHDLGIASFWKTGKACYSPLMKNFLGLEEKDEVLAFIYLGYPDMVREVRENRTGAVYTTWMNV